MGHRNFVATRFPNLWIGSGRQLKRSLGCVHHFRPTYPDFLHEAPPTPACAAFIKERRMNFANAGKLDRKSGVRFGERGAPVDCLRGCDHMGASLQGCAIRLAR
jgi:hypothetical protein